jgi:hypothetical protein
VPDLDDIILGPEDEPPNRRKTSRRPRQRLLPLPGPFVRVPIQWLCKPGREHVIRARERLFFYLLYRSRWGQRGVGVTDATIAEIGAPRTTVYDALNLMERKGWIRVERGPGRALVVWPIVLSA